MKVVFLDIDGVLNSNAYDRVRDCTKNTNIDETRIPLLQELVDKTGAVLVLSSSWRKHWHPDPNLCDESGRAINDSLAKYGLRIYDKTPQIGTQLDRKAEIDDWLNYCGENVESFVILDDYAFGWDEYTNRLVKTDRYRGRGLEARHVAQAVALLNAKDDE